MRFRAKGLAAAVVAAALATGSAARAVIIERVVAVVGERPILLSDLQRRSRPFLYRILASTQNPAQVAAATTEMQRELLNRMIDDRLEEQAADKARLSVSSEEVDNALRNIATQGHISVTDLLSEARRQGLDEQAYRDEIRRQVLEGKLVQLRVRGRVRVTDQDARAQYQRYITEVGKQIPVNLQILALRIPPAATPDQVKQVMNLGNKIVSDVRAGADFCKMVAQYSQSPSPQPCGATGLQMPTALLPQIASAIDGVAPGEVSEAIQMQDQAVLIAKVVERRAPAYDEVKDQMWERAFGESMEHQRKAWLDELRRGVYVDVRL
jgi:peptidyl-prolyl cis-trans isomerase SurA